MIRKSSYEVKGFMLVEKNWSCYGPQSSSIFNLFIDFFFHNKENKNNFIPLGLVPSIKFICQSPLRMFTINGDRKS